MNQVVTHTLPKIVLSEEDHDRLVTIAEGAIRRDHDAAEELLAELDRAIVVPGNDVPADVVRMGSRVTFSIEGSDVHSVTLVYPLDADIAQGKLSVLTPVGAALIGLARGQSISWLTPAGQTRRLTVSAVQPPQIAAG